MKKENKLFSSSQILKKMKSQDSFLFSQVKELHQIQRHWPSLIGKNYSQFTQALGIENRILWIECQNSALLQDLSFQKKDIHEKINLFFKQKILKDIRFLVKGAKKP